ncbi:class I SAM-dependent methyltransferase [Clostridium sp. 'deep sea']|uniref:class I SAM-dependent methyltransferase n=1 Tax=Clostridium sp. 'deep sea' TaxID=2779445 RepID=UPI001896420E|nr:methyltransferase domain-containing protein [Clostridium sp. 'deep sea']QOR35231.1 class I SAM-dependent methyltransferase [Clostridium sp. 'deep sea']
MNKYNECKQGHKLGRHRKGPSSFHMQDYQLVFNELKLEENEVFLDLGCGSGDYSFEASKRVGQKGIVYAIDGMTSIITKLKEQMQQSGINNIIAKVSDITSNIDLKDNSVDVCFICTVLHSLDIELVKERLFNEICRVLKPGARMFIVECKKERMGFGPPLHVRISADNLDKLVEKYNFEKVNYVDFGYNYMNQYIFK